MATVPHGRFVTGDLGGQVSLWDMAAGKRLATGKEHGRFVAALAVSPDGKLAASSDFDGTVRLWKLADGQSRQEGDSENEGVRKE